MMDGWIEPVTSDDFPSVAASEGFKLFHLIWSLINHLCNLEKYSIFKEGVGDMVYIIAIIILPCFQCPCSYESVSSTFISLAFYVVLDLYFCRYTN